MTTKIEGHTYLQSINGPTYCHKNRGYEYQYHQFAHDWKYQVRRVGSTQWSEWKPVKGFVIEEASVQIQIVTFPIPVGKHHAKS